MTMNRYKEQWLKNQYKIWESLVGIELNKMYAIPEPLDWYDEDETLPIHTHSSIHFQHFAKCWIVLNDNRILKITTSEDEDVYGVFISNVNKINDSDERLIEINYTGRIESSILKVEKDNIAEVNLTINGETKIIASGEVEPQWDGYIIRKLDESILLFESQEDFDKTVFEKSIKIDLRNN